MSALIQVTGLASVYMINSSEATIADVKRWLDEVEKLGIPDTTRLESTNLKVTLRSEHLELIKNGIIMHKKDGEM